MVELIKTAEFDRWIPRLFRAARSHLIVLLCGGDKSTQRRDIAKARALAADWKDEQP